jgi:PTH1 family peptidyl-tRNA hydrolase
MKLIVGLGNPGREYERTRHNVGWWFLEHLADAWRLDTWRKDGEARATSGAVHGTRVRLVRPLTYMNLSGEVLRPYLRRAFFAVSNDLLVVVDDVALPVGRYRFREKGSAGGHNGLRSIEQHVGTQAYARLRIGVGPPAGYERATTLSDYVLGDFGKREAADVRALFPTLTEAIELWMREGMKPVMNRYTGKATDADNGE